MVIKEFVDDLLDLGDAADDEDERAGGAEAFVLARLVDGDPSGGLLHLEKHGFPPDDRDSVGCACAAQVHEVPFGGLQEPGLEPGVPNSPRIGLNFEKISDFLADFGFAFRKRVPQGLRLRSSGGSSPRPAPESAG